MPIDKTIFQAWKKQRPCKCLRRVKVHGQSQGWTCIKWGSSHSSGKTDITRFLHIGKFPGNCQTLLAVGHSLLWDISGCDFALHKSEVIDWTQIYTYIYILVPNPFLKDTDPALRLTPFFLILLLPVLTPLLLSLSSTWWPLTPLSQVPCEGSGVLTSNALTRLRLWDFRELSGPSCLPGCRTYTVLCGGLTGTDCPSSILRSVAPRPQSHLAALGG